MPQSSHKTMKKNNMIKSTKKKETMKKYEIGIVKYTDKFVKLYTSCNTMGNLNIIMKRSFINVEAKDPIEAIQMHNEVFDNHKDVKEYLIIPKKNKS